MDGETQVVYVVCRYGFLGGDDATIGAFSDQAVADAYCELYERAYGCGDQSYGVEALELDCDLTEHRADLAEIIAERDEALGGAS